MDGQMDGYIYIIIQINRQVVMGLDRIGQEYKDIIRLGLIRFDLIQITFDFDLDQIGLDQIQIRFDLEPDQVRLDQTVDQMIYSIRLQIRSERYWIGLDWTIGLDLTDVISNILNYSN